MLRDWEFHQIKQFFACTVFTLILQLDTLGTKLGTRTWDVLCRVHKLSIVLYLEAAAYVNTYVHWTRAQVMGLPLKVMTIIYYFDTLGLGRWDFFRKWVKMITPSASGFVDWALAGLTLKYRCDRWRVGWLTLVHLRKWMWVIIFVHLTTSSYIWKIVWRSAQIRSVAQRLWQFTDVVFSCAKQSGLQFN